MNNKSDYQLLVMQATIESNRQDSDETLKNPTESLIAMITSMMDQIKISKSSSETNDLPKSRDPTTVIQANNRDTPLGGGNYEKNGGMWNLKHEIRSPKFYELLIKTELKEDTALDIKKLYNHIKMYLNAMTRL